MVLIHRMHSVGSETNESLRLVSAHFRDCCSKVLMSMWSNRIRKILNIYHLCMPLCMHTYIHTFSRLSTLAWRCIAWAMACARTPVSAWPACSWLRWPSRRASVWRLWRVLSSMRQGEDLFLWRLIFWNILSLMKWTGEKLSGKCFFFMRIQFNYWLYTSYALLNYSHGIWSFVRNSIGIFFLFWHPFFLRTQIGNYMYIICIRRDVRISFSKIP